LAYGEPKGIAFAAPGIAKRTHRTKNYCGASPVFAETPLLSLGTYATC